MDDSGLRALAAKNGGKISLPDGIPLATPGETGAKNIIFTSQWDNYPREVSVPLAGKSSHAFLLMAGSTDAMKSRFDNGEVIVTYTDGATARLALNNPVNWWPIDQDYFMDDYAFRRDGADSAARGFADGKNPHSRRGKLQGQRRKSSRRRGDGSGFAAGPGQGIEIADRSRASPMKWSSA